MLQTLVRKWSYSGSGFLTAARAFRIQSSGNNFSVLVPWMKPFTTTPRLSVPEDSDDDDDRTGKLVVYKVI